MITVRIGHMEYHVNEASDLASYIPCTDTLKPELTAEEMILTEKGGKLSRHGHISTNSLVPLLAKRIKELEEKLNHVESQRNS